MTTAMAREMAEQPAVLGRLVNRFEHDVERIRAALPGTPAAVTLLARGSSDNAALYGRYLIELALGRPVAMAAPSLYTRYGATGDYSGTVVVAVSQSGDTPEIVSAAITLARCGATVIGVTNGAASRLAAESDVTYWLAAGEETAVPATKTVTAQFFAMLAVADAIRPTACRPALSRLPDDVARLLAGQAPVTRLVERWHESRGLVVLGRGLLAAAAHETALKVREICRIGAVGASIADFLHGPIGSVRAGDPVLVLAGDPATDQDVVLIRERLGSRGADAEYWDVRAQRPAERDGGDTLLPILAVVHGQQLALDWAVRLGLDPDRPDGLTKLTLTH
jgi:glucosamine--fructose-6-phosphate aminotransferase (isomerizing)